MNSVDMPAQTALKSPFVSTGFGLTKPRLSLAGFLLVAISSWLVSAATSQAQTYTYTTLAGIGGKAGALDGAGGGIGFPLFNLPSGVVVSKTGNLYITDSGNQLIRELTPSGAVTTLAGSVGQAGIADGTGIAAFFNSPQGPAVDSSGNLYVADFSNAVIRKVTPAGVVTTLAGAALSTGSADGTGTAARFLKPSGVAVDSSGNVFVADSGNHTIRKVTSAGVVTTFAGTAGTAGSADGTGAAALFNNPRGLAFDSTGNLYVADTTNNSIRKITSAGVVTTLAGKTGTFGSTDDTGSAARFNFPNSLAVDSSGNIYVADEINNTIRKVTSAGVVTTLAGTAGSTGKIDGTGSAARFNRPTGVTVDGSGNVYVADYQNQLIRKITPSGAVTTVAGVAGMLGAIDGVGYNLTPVLLFNPSSTALDAAGNIYFSDTGNNTIRRISATGVVTTVAGSTNSIGRVDGTGTAASFNGPAGLASDAAGNLYVADTVNHLIRKVTAAGVVTTFAGTGGTAGSADGVGTAASFKLPSSVALDGSGNVYVADYDNHTIRVITPAGQVSTLAGTAGVTGSADGVGAAARFNHPRGLTVDGSGNVYVADSGNNTVRKISAGGVVLTLAGAAGSVGAVDGGGNIARFSGPSGIAVDAAGNLYVADTNNSTIRLVTPGGVVSTIGGSAGAASNVDGVGTAARFDHPNGLSADASGNIYIADTRNHTIKRGATSSGSGGTGGNGGSGGSGGTGGTGGSGGSGGSGGNGGTGGTGGGSGTGTGFVLRPSGLAYGTSSGFYVADTANNSIKLVAADGTVTVFAGKDGSAGSANGTGTAATFNGPTGMVSDSVGNLYVCDTGNATIRKITSTGVVTTLAGSPGSRGAQDGTGSAALFSAPTGIAIDSTGAIFVTDAANNTIRKVTIEGVVTTFAGAALSSGEADGVGTAARFNNPTGVIITSTNILYVADTYNHTIRKINTADILATDSTVATPAGTVTTLAGSAGISGAFDGTGAYALFNRPTGVGIDASFNVLVADTANSSIRRVSPAGVVTTIAGLAGISGNRDGTNTVALFNQPQALLVSSAIIVADTGNSIIRTINSQAAVSTLSLKSPTTTTPSTGDSGSSGGGGGATESWLVAALLAASATRVAKRRFSRR